jgi:hypothetical protein
VDYLFLEPGTVTLLCYDEAGVDAQSGAFPVDLSDLGVMVDFIFSTPGTVALSDCP